MKTLNQWIKAHPYKALLFLSFFELVAASMAVVNEMGFWCGLVLFISLLLFWAITFSLDSKLPIILAVALAATSAEAAEPPQTAPGIAVGVVVICVGGYCVYKVVKFCQRKFPKESTNSPSAFMPQGDGETAASWNYGSMGSCDPTLTPGSDLLAQDSAGTVFTVDVRIDEEGNASIGTSALGEAATQSWTDFQADVARHGVQITGSADGSQYFATNGVPCSPDDIPISFDAVTQTVDIKDSGGPVRLIVLERSRDLHNWSPFLRTRVGTGGPGLRIQDATTAVSMFYRVTVSDSQ